MQGSLVNNLDLGCKNDVCLFRSYAISIKKVRLSVGIWRFCAQAHGRMDVRLVRALSDDFKTTA